MPKQWFRAEYRSPQETSWNRGGGNGRDGEEAGCARRLFHPFHLTAIQAGIYVFWRHVRRDRNGLFCRSPFCLAALWAMLLAPRTACASISVVDQAAPGSADTNAGHEESPFKMVQHAAEVVKPGDIIYVMAGRYDERVRVRGSGTEGQPITFQAMPRRTAVVEGSAWRQARTRLQSGLQSNS